MNAHRQWGIRIWLICLVLFMLESRQASALVNVEFRPVHQVVSVGEPVLLGMYLVSDSDSIQTVASLGAILEWDPHVLALDDEVINNGEYPWLASGFPDDSGLDGLNNTFADGSALYNAFGQLAPHPPMNVTPDGDLVTTFVFHTLAETPLTAATLPLTMGEFTRTQILDGFTPGVDVTGTISGATLILAPEPSALAFLLVALLINLRALANMKFRGIGIAVS